jgi:uncharacterized protein YlxP (DUF503 family)
MVIGACQIIFYLEGMSSLKDKRQIIRKIIDRTRHKFNAAIAETGANDHYQVAIIGFTVVSNSETHTHKMISKICDFIEKLHLAPISDQHIETFFVGNDVTPMDVVTDHADMMNIDFNQEPKEQ